MYSIRQTLIKGVALLIGFAMMLMISEFILIVYSSYISSEEMEPGLIQPDSNLGWKLAPNWRGRHLHHDYDVSYSVNFKGLRNPDVKRTETKRLVVGDSFTFGLGVADTETFSALLQQQDQAPGVINGGVPGYSPEQVVLRGIQLAQQYRPEQIVLMLYLGNDLADIGHEFAVQAPGSKPYIQLDEKGRGVLQNFPVQSSIREQQETLADRILKQPGAVYSSNLLRLLLTEVTDGGELDSAKIDHSIELFIALLNYLKVNTDASVHIALLPGASALLQDTGVTARYQAYLRQNLLTRLADESYDVIDLLPHMQDAETGRLYFPNDGHLTPYGHEVVAGHLGQRLLTPE